MRIGIFGGSFNPIHNGHVILGETMLHEMKLDEVWYMVSPHNPLKQAADLLDENERLHLVELALEGHEGLKACNFEFQLKRPSYTWDTLQALHLQYPQHEFSLIIGGDNWEVFDKWAHHEEILQKYKIAVFPREGSDIDEALLPENVRLIHVPLVNVTSTQLRQMLRESKSITDYVPYMVEEEIKQRKLYR